MLTSNLTPVPLEVELAMTEPVTAVFFERAAMYWAPCGLSFVTGAESAKIVGARMATRPKMRVVRRIMLMMKDCRC